MNSRGIRCTLKGSEKLRLAEWLRTNTVRILAERPRRVELAQQASAALDLKLTYSVVGNMLAVLGIEYVARESAEAKAKRARSLRERPRRGLHAKARATLEAKVERLETRLAFLEKSLGVQPPEPILF